MKIYGIIGYPLGHSFSHRFFGNKFQVLGLTDHRYYKFEIENISRLSEILTEYPDLCGFNVTIPYKKDIIGMLDEITPEAKEIGAVNCVKIQRGRLKGYNTDIYGFRAGLDELLGSSRPKALVLGTGGASNAVRYVLGREGIDHITVSRSKTAQTLTYDELTPDLLQSHHLIVNTTPLGTWPETSEKPQIPYEYITAEHFMYDLVYNPPLTVFLEEGKKHGASIMNGGKMLYEQAENCWEIWNQ